MSHEMGHPETSEGISVLFGVDALIAQRRELFDELGVLSRQLNEAQMAYNACIGRIIQVNGQLAEQDPNRYDPQQNQQAQGALADELYELKSDEDEGVA